MFYSQGNKKQGHQLRVSTVGVGVRGLRTEEKILKKKFHRDLHGLEANLATSLQTPQEA